jgi:hypothetical protein
LPDYYGLFKYNFIKYARIVFFSSRLLFILSLHIKDWQQPLTLGGALFVMLHGLFHINMLLNGMVSTVLDSTIEIFGIVMPSLLALLLLVLRVKQGRLKSE